MKKLIAWACTLCVLLGCMVMPTGATCSSGIKGNGTSGIYIDINSAPYTTFAQKSYGEYAYGREGCAWFASARVNQLTGKGSTIWSGWSWYYSAYSSLGFSRGSEPKAKALACYENHVAVVEKVDGSTITVSEGGMGGLSDSAHGYCVISTMSRSKLESDRGTGSFYGYVYLGDVPSPTPITYYTVKFNANGGETTRSIVQVAHGCKPDESIFPTPVRNGYTFKYWCTESGKIVSTDTPILESMTLYAQWEENIKYYTLTFDSNGGDVSRTFLSVAHGCKPTSPALPTPTRDGYDFAGWYTSSGELVSLETPILKNMELTAKWTKSIGPYLVTFNTNGGTLGDAFIVRTADGDNMDRGTYQTIIYWKDGAPIKTNKFGTEAAVDANGKVVEIREYGSESLLTVPYCGFVISSHSTSSVNDSAYLVEELKIGNYVAYDEFTKKIYAYKDQNDYLAHHKTAITGNTYGELPIPVRDGYTFDGWYTAPSGGTQVTASTKVTASSDHTLYAHWIKQEEPVAPPVTPTTGIHFTKVSTYTQGQFTDVPASQWFTSSVASAVEFGLMKGNSAATFNPYGDVTLAEAITMASRIHSIYTTGSEAFVQDAGDKWYQVYLDYAYQNGIISQAYYTCDVTQKATRAQFAEIFANSLPDAGLEVQNTVADNAIPDVPVSSPYAPSVYRLYRAGILTGGDVKGTFSPLTYITRAESAAIVARMADTDNRMDFTLE